MRARDGDSFIAMAEVTVELLVSRKSLDRKLSI